MKIILLTKIIDLKFQGCPNNRKFREKPAEIWYEFRNKTPHFRAIIDNNRMGCAATKKGNNVCLFCYLARKR